eukprot:scaffold17415_cov147-Isochrysis_galbana.AAC.8
MGGRAFVIRTPHTPHPHLRSKKKSLVETRDTLTAARRDTSVHYLPVAPPLPSHSFPTPFSLFRPSISEGWCQSCVHYNSLGWGIESLGFSVVLDPMSASLSASLRVDCGGALDRCVAIFGRADQHSAGAEGAPYRLSIGAWPFVQTWRGCLRHQGQRGG